MKCVYFSKPIIGEKFLVLEEQVGAMKSSISVWFQSIKKITLKLMSKKKKRKKTNIKNVQKVYEQKQPKKRNTLIFGGI
tara:strand:+ start:53 stop:289 length:237 start_codon:yes stop_codon:yes gene_type:complete